MIQAISTCSSAADLRKWPLMQWLIVFILTAVGLIVRCLIDPWLGDRHEFVPAYAAVAGATWLAGWRAGAVTATLSVLGVHLFPMRSEMDFDAVHNAVSLAGFIGISAVIIGVAEAVGHFLNGLAEKVSRLEQTDRRRSDFIAVVAHELRNPLSAIATGATLIKDGHLAPGELEDTWQMVQRQTENMTRLVGDLLDTARIAEGKLALNREEVRVSRAVQEAVAALSPFTEAKKQRVVVHMPHPAGSVLADGLRMHQVLGNLLHNASKFAPENSVITIAVEPSDEAVAISVKDTGIGIPSSELLTIFQPFVQVSPQDDRQHGVGLGLSLTGKLMEMHGGSVQARSEGPGLGAEFTVRFPRGPHGIPELPGAREPAAPMPDGAGARPAAAPLKLLVVDDNGDAAETLAVLLRLKGHQATTASTGATALQLAARERPDFVFLDLGLPDMSGLDVAMKVRREVQGKQPVLIALTGWGTDEDRRRTKAAGFDSHLTKPVTLDQIDEALAISASARVQQEPC